jgi:hypothetical protein
MIKTCIMNVEFSSKPYALFSRNSRLNNPMGIPDSNLLTLNRAAEYYGRRQPRGGGPGDSESGNFKQMGFLWVSCTVQHIRGAEFF